MNSNCLGRTNSLVPVRPWFNQIYDWQQVIYTLFLESNTSPHYPLHLLTMPRDASHHWQLEEHFTFQQLNYL